MRSSLYPYQRDLVKWARARHYSALFADMGLGKSLVAIECLEADYQNFNRVLQQGEWKAIYVCKNSLTGTVAAEFDKWSSPLRVVRFRAGLPAPKRLQLVQSEWDVLVVNIESLRSAEIIKALTASGASVLIIDEAQIIKNRRAIQTRAARTLAAQIKRSGGRIMIMTGTPITKSILDLWSECDVLWPGGTSTEHILGMGNYQSYEHSVAIVTPHPKIRGVKLYKYVEDGVDRVTKAMSPFSRVERLHDHIDLPSHIYHTVKLAMEPGQRRIYDALKKDLIACVAGVELDTHSASVLSSEGIERYNETQLVATPQLTTLMLRLQQITSGHVKTLDGEIHTLPSAKLAWLRETLPNMTAENGDHKLVIFCRFIKDVDDIVALSESLGIGCVRLDGSTSRFADAYAEQFRTSRDIRLLVGNVALAGVGFTFVSADYCVFYSHSFSYGDRVQALKRLDRIGQTRSVVYYDLVAEDSIDEYIMTNLTQKQDTAVRTLDQLKALLV